MPLSAEPTEFPEFNTAQWKRNRAPMARGPSVVDLRQANRYRFGAGAGFGSGVGVTRLLPLVPELLPWPVSEFGPVPRPCWRFALSGLEPTVP